MIYLDNAATTSIDDRVLQAMLPWFSGRYGNPSALYSLGREARSAIEKARAQVAALVNCRPEQIVFTSGGSEANNLAIRGYLGERSGVLISNTEHDSVWAATDTQRYFRAAVQAQSDGRIMPSAFEGLSLKCFDFASVMYVNNEIGVINPVKELAACCHENKLTFHTDCVQALGSVKVDVQDIGCDFASFSSHKIHGPKGVGALFVKDPAMIKPLIAGGEAQEFGLRGGTENVAGIVGFGEACCLLQDEFEANMKHISELRTAFLEELNGCETPPHIISDEKVCTPKILNVRFDGIDAQTLVLMADKYGVCISAGSACHSHMNKPSVTLLALGLTEDEARSCVRISFSANNKIEEVRHAARIIELCTHQLQTLR